MQVGQLTLRILQETLALFQDLRRVRGSYTRNLLLDRREVLPSAATHCAAPLMRSVKAAKAGLSFKTAYYKRTPRRLHEHTAEMAFYLRRRRECRWGMLPMRA